MPVKAKNSSTKPLRGTERGWRDDPQVSKLHARLLTFSKEAATEFEDIKVGMLGIQRSRVKASKLLHDDIGASGVKKLREVIAQDKAHRSSVVARLLEVHDRLSYMKDALSIIRRRVKSSYGAELRKEYGAITNQNEGIEDHFTRTVKAIKDGELVVKLADLIIMDIDQSAFSDQRLLRTSELLFHPGRAD